MATNFVTGTTPQLGGGNVFTENSNGEWELAGITGPSIVRQIFTADGTYTPSPGMIVCEVIATGAGGGGGYGRTTTDGDTAAGGGGQAGGTAIKLYTPAEIGATAAIVIGSGGTGGVASTSTAGADGGTTTFTPTGTGATLSCDGGDVGSSDATDGGGSGNSANGGSSEGTATGGDLNLAGNDGRSGCSWYDSGSAKECGLSGDGGGSYWGGRGRGANMSGDSASFTGVGHDAEAYGSGGGGGVARNGGQADGGDGFAGIVVVTEYIRQNAHWPIATDVNGNEVLDLTGGTASAVNYVDINNAATGNNPAITAVGDDTNIDLELDGKGTGGVSVLAPGITFDGSNYMDDYEEGTWTPALEFGGDSTGITYSNQSGAYTKIGNTVHCTLFLTLTANGSGTGNATISGLPFTSISGVRSTGACYVNNAADSSVPLFNILASQTEIEIRIAASNTASFFTDTELGGNENIWGTIVYETAS